MVAAARRDSRRLGGAVAVWNLNDAQGSVRAQRVSATGDLLWGEDGVTVFADPSSAPQAMDVVRATDGGFVVLYRRATPAGPGADRPEARRGRRCDVGSGADRVLGLRQHLRRDSDQHGVGRRRRGRGRVRARATATSTSTASAATTSSTRASISAASDNGRRSCPDARARLDGQYGGRSAPARAQVLRYEAPLTSMMAPVQNSEPSAARKSTAWATSSGRATRPSGL